MPERVFSLRDRIRRLDIREEPAEVVQASGQDTPVLCLGECSDMSSQEETTAQTLNKLESLHLLSDASFSSDLLQEVAGEQITNETVYRLNKADDKTAARRQDKSTHW